MDPQHSEEILSNDEMEHDHHNLSIYQEILAGIQENLRLHGEMLARMQPSAPRIPGIEQFRKMNPKIFSGTEGPLEAIEWLRSVEAIATAIRIPQLGWTEAAVFSPVASCLYLVGCRTNTSDPAYHMGGI